jgi:hypothetical protein
VSDEQVSETHDALTRALSQLRSALDLLDSSKAPAHIGAHVDLAIHQLQDAIESATFETFSDGQESSAPLIH